MLLRACIALCCQSHQSQKRHYPLTANLLFESVGYISGCRHRVSTHTLAHAGMAGSVPSLLQAHDRPGLQNTELPSPNTRHGHSHWSAQSRDYCFKIVYIQVCQKETVCPRKTSSNLTHLAGSMHQPSQRSRLDRIRSLWRSCRSHIPSNKFTPKTAEFNHAAQSPRHRV